MGLDGDGQAAARHSSSLEGIQILRAAAALLVVLSHTLLESLAAVAPPKSPAWLTAFGSVGVDIFFVISGFIMFYVSFPAHRPNVAPAAFLLKRLTRIYPFYWFCVALTFGFWSLGLVPSIQPDRSILIRSVLLFPSNYFVIGVAWTLVYEMYFYLIFAATLYFSRPLVSLYGTSITILVLYALSNWAPDPVLRAFLGNPIAIEFCFGLFLAYLFREWPNFASAARLLWIPGLALLVAAPMIAPYASTHFPPSPARVLWGIPAFLIVASFLSLKTNGTPLRRHMVLLGDASYAIYLTHPLTLISYAWLLKGSLTNFPQWPVIPFFVVLCAGFGVLIHVFVERQLIKAVRGLFRWLGTSPMRGSPQPLERPEELQTLK